MYEFKNTLDMIISVARSITFIDIIDILLMSYIVYIMIKLIRETRAGQLVKGIIFVFIAYVLSNIINLKAMSYIIKSALDVGLLAILIMFQPEIRRALEKAGRTKIAMNLFNIGNNSITGSQWHDAIEAICDSCVDMSATKTGALIVIERQTKLGEQIETGTLMKAAPSKELFENIFFKNSPLHDGAVIMRNGKIHAAACFLPKPQKEELINKKLGSRHRAAIGMSENSDAIIVAVSEETGQISIAHNGEIMRDFTKFKLNQYLRENLIPETPETKKIIPIKKNLRNKEDKE